MHPSVAIEPQIRARIPLYAAGLASSAMGLAALHAVLTGGAFTAFAAALIAIGYCISWGVRARLISASALATVALVILISTLSAVIIEPQFRFQLIPAEALDAPDLLAAIVLTSLMVVYSFKLTTDMSVVFLCVPSLSLIGLLATADPSAEMLAYFGIYLACTCFVLIQQNALASRKVCPVPGSALRLHFGITAGVTLAALAVGSLIGTTFYPIIAGAFMARISDMDPTQMMDQTTQEFVPVATGPVALSNQELLTVKCDRPLLWREKTYNRYTGQGWSSELLPQEQRWIHPTEERGKSGEYTFRIIDPLNPAQRSAVETVEQTYHITNGVYRAVFAAAEPVTVRYDGWPPVIRVSGGLEAGGLYTKGWSYHVVSEVSAATPRDLRNSSDVYPEYIKARYLGTPQSCWQVQKLTNRLTETASTPLQKAQNLAHFLSSEYIYDTNAPAAPSSKDAVTYFLFQSKRGYCDIFASAMVIMSRQAGIPARWATGFAPGEYDSGDGVYHVREKDRHAWAELYFPGYGWMPFDITPAQQETSWLAGLKESWRVLASDKASLFAGGLLFFLIAYLVKAEVIDRIRRAGKRPGWSPTPATSEIGVCYQRMCRILARYARPRSAATTPLEYASQTIGFIRLEEISEAVDFLTAGFVEFRYSGREPTPDTIEAMKQTLRALARGLKTAKRGRLLPKQ